MRAAVVSLCLVAGCGFSASLPLPNGGADGDIDGIPELDAFLPDATQMCPSESAMCVPGTGVLRECKIVGQPAIDTTCVWGCLTSAPGPHCGKLVPSGNAVMTPDLDPDPALQEKSLNLSGVSPVVFNTDNGSLSGIRGGGSIGQIVGGVDFQIRNGVGIFRFKRLTITGFDSTPIRVVGANALAIVATTQIELKRAILDMRGDCSGSAPGPGGQPGGAAGTIGTGMGGGGAGESFTSNRSSGGGGAGYGARGGTGGKPAGETGPAGGMMYGNSTITVLAGGSGGGGGGGGGGVGGGGGGAIHLVANERVRFEGNVFGYSGVNAGGCGGAAGVGNKASGGGGGAGGVILGEAAKIELSVGGLAVNGGGGGSCAGSSGSDGGFSTNRANGGTGASGGGSGASGGAAGGVSGNSASDNNNAGAGGGGVGWIRLNTASGGVSMQNGSFTSPSFNDNNTTSTRGTATVL